LLRGTDVVLSFSGLVLNVALIVDVIVTNDDLFMIAAVGLVGSIYDCGSTSVAGDGSLIPGIIDDCGRDSLTESRLARDGSLSPNCFACMAIILLELSVYGLFGASIWPCFFKFR